MAHLAIPAFSCSRGRDLGRERRAKPGQTALTLTLYGRARSRRLRQADDAHSRRRITVRDRRGRLPTTVVDDLPGALLHHHARGGLIPKNADFRLSARIRS
jgi:hypothetical protein